MDARQYFQQIIQPTIKEYAADRTSIRRGFLACVVTYHMIDYLRETKSAATLRAKMRKACPSFIVIDRVAHAFKHAETGNPSGQIEPLTSAQVISRPPAVAGKLLVGVSRVGDAFGGVTIASAVHVDLLAELGMVQYYYEGLLDDPQKLKTLIG